jgi:hypothetical protein
LSLVRRQQSKKPARVKQPINQLLKDELRQAPTTSSLRELLKRGSEITVATVAHHGIERIILADTLYIEKENNDPKQKKRCFALVSVVSSWRRRQQGHSIGVSLIATGSMPCTVLCLAKQYQWQHQSMSHKNSVG